MQQVDRFAANARLDTLESMTAQENLRDLLEKTKEGQKTGSEKEHIFFHPEGAGRTRRRPPIRTSRSKLEAMIARASIADTRKGHTEVIDNPGADQGLSESEEDDSADEEVGFDPTYAPTSLPFMENPDDTAPKGAYVPPPEEDGEGEKERQLKKKKSDDKEKLVKTEYEADGDDKNVLLMHRNLLLLLACTPLLLLKSLHPCLQKST
eukprot:TRINITY_DN5262_c0_g1_i1.p1 TRINITY_DN5262_c0_g1~~TRINITY_DN5262_c0_g1_i1.p1  ORF type:complete len:208 (+),score=43.03 TRINITY_DN5262_c0_g1_i1:400-1023(+)